MTSRFAETGSIEIDAPSSLANGYLWANISFFFFEVDVRVLTVQLVDLFKMSMQKLLVLHGMWVERCMAACRIDNVDLLHQLLAAFIHARGNKFFPHIISGAVVRVHHVLGIKTIIPKVIHHQFISREIKCMLQFCHNTVHSLYQSSLAPVVLYETIA